jgi:carbonic anhydrase
MPNADDMLRSAAERSDELAAPDLSPRPRIDLFPMLGIARGDAHIIRNAGGLVTDDALRSLTVSQQMLGTEEVVVVMHENCGLHRPDGDAREFGAFTDLEGTLREGLERLRAELPARDHIRGFVFDPQDGSLREIS